MEHNDEVEEEVEVNLKERNQNLISIITMVGMWVVAVLLLIAIVVLVKNIQEIKTDPIAYGIDKKGYNICSCYTPEGKSYDYDANGPVEMVRNRGSNYDFDLEQYRYANMTIDE